MSALLERVRRVGSTPSSPFAAEVLAGLSMRPKTIAASWLYDHRGWQLHTLAAAQPECAGPRAEAALIGQAAAAIAAAAGDGATVVEAGGGGGPATLALLAALPQPAAFVPVDACESFAAESALALQQRLPGLAIRPLARDFSRLAVLPPAAPGSRRLVRVGADVLSRFAADAAAALLDRLGRAAGPGSLLLAGADGTRDPAERLAACADAAGVVAAFNRNLLVRVNRELAADFCPQAFRHVARLDAAAQRVDLHLVAAHAQQVQVLAHAFRFVMGESIRTASVHAHPPLQLQALAARAGWTPLAQWHDAAGAHALVLFERRRSM